jgi:hypothetical protein
MLLPGAQYIVKVFFCQPFVKNFAKKGIKGARHRAHGWRLEKRSALGWRHYSFALFDLLPQTSNLQHLLCQLPALPCLLETPHSQFLPSFDTTDYGPLTTDNLEQL